MTYIFRLPKVQAQKAEARSILQSIWICFIAFDTSGLRVSHRIAVIFSQPEVEAVGRRFLELA